MKNFIKYNLWLLPIIFVLFAKSSSAMPVNDKPLELLSLPPLQVLEELTLKRAGLDPSIIQKWQKNSRLAAALPRIQVGYEQKAQIQNTAVVQDSISVTSYGVNIGPEANKVDQNLGQNTGFEFKAVWALDELLFNHDQLDVSRESRDLLLMRSQLVQDLHQTYYELKGQLLHLQEEPDLKEDPFERLKTEQLIDKLNSLTGGEFKKLLKDYKIPLNPPFSKGDKIEGAKNENSTIKN